MSNLFFSSDLHFGHANSIKYCNRPFSDVQEMNEGLIAGWNRVVGKNDTVWTLGDFAFMQLDPIMDVLSRLNGNHHMVLGNHCQKIAANRKLLLEKGLVKEIRDYKELSFDKQKIVLFHYPQRAWNGSHYGSWQLHGHVHGTMEPYGRSVDVGVDAAWVTGKAEYRPLSFEELREYMKSREVVADF